MKNSIILFSSNYPLGFTHKTLSETLVLHVICRGKKEKLSPQGYLIIYMIRVQM